MRKRISRPGIRIALCTLAIGLVYCSSGNNRPTLVADNPPAAYVDASGGHEHHQYDSALIEYPHIRMADGQVTLNDRCPVRKSPLNLRLPPVYVNARPVGFC